MKIGLDITRHAVTLNFDKYLLLLALPNDLRFAFVMIGWINVSGNAKKPIDKANANEQLTK